MTQCADSAVGWPPADSWGGHCDVGEQGAATKHLTLTWPRLVVFFTSLLTLVSESPSLVCHK